MSTRLLLLATVLLVVVSSIAADSACSNALEGKIHDSESLNSIVAGVRERFLKTRPNPFTRCDITVLIPQGDGTYVRASYNQNGLGYPASTVKLTFMAAALEWCKQKGKGYDCLDAHVRPMIYTSDNFETGVVVDWITGAPNYIPTTNDATTPEFREWWKKRNFTNAYFASRGLLEDQLLISKTYPANSGGMPAGAEALMRQVLGQNMMKPKCAASLMAEIAGGLIHPGPATNYMLGILQHARYSYSSFGMGTPPGSAIYTKIGNAYDTLEEIAHIRLPDSKTFILAVYTNGYEPRQPKLDNLSYLAELLIDGLGLAKGQPPKLILNATQATYQGSGWTWDHSIDSKYGNKFHRCDKAGCTATWVADLESDTYEVSVWHPDHASVGSASFALKHAYGTDTMGINQRVNAGRWVKLGDFVFKKGTPAVLTVTSPSNGLFFVDAVKFHQWPSCNGIPGTPCDV